MSSSADRFLRIVNQAKLRIRDFEGALGQGLLGDGAREEYGSLGASDRGQIRESYLASLERVQLRETFYKLYAYY